MRRVLRFVVADQRGMSLAEILVACVIIAIGLVGLLSAVPTASYGIQEGQQLSTATFLANQRLEQVRNAQWVAAPAADTLGVSASTSVAPTSGGLTTFADETPMAAPYSGFSRTVRITDCGVGAGCGGIVDPGLRQVTVAVSYRPSTATGVAAVGTTKSAIVSMLMAQR
ncbi:MAG: hypothetical protein DMD77_18740 [Candidatus Rokuibacteriota bacterium]|nr:MAG: hypothetical protein DMD77_18740 [Candidatus Rokubacteria bacterium]